MSQQQFNQLFLGEMTEVAARQQADQLLNRHRANGARGAISALFSDRGMEQRARRIAATIPGLNYGPPVLAAALASLVKSRGFADQILKGDNSAFANSVRTFARLLPALSMGVGESLSDAIERWVSEVEDDPSIPKQDRKGMLDGDRLYLCSSVPGVVFVARVDDNGDIVWLDQGALIPEVINNHGEWRQAYTVWNQIGRGNTRQVGPKNNRQPVTDRGQPFCFKISADEAVQILGQVGADDRSIQAVQALLRKPNYYRDLSDESITVLLATSRASRRFNPIQCKVYEDFLRDLPKNGNAIGVNRFLERFHTLVVDPAGRPNLADDDFLTLIEAIDQHLDANLEPATRFMRKVAEGYDRLTRVRGLNPLVAAPVALLVGIAVTTPVWGAGLVTIGAALAFSVTFWHGFVMHVSSTTTASLLGATGNSVYIGMLSVLIGSIGWFAITWSFPVWELVVNTLFFWLPEEHRGWLRSIGRKIAAFAMGYGALQAVLIFLEVDVMFRVLTLAPAMAKLAVGFALTEAELSKGSYVAKMIAKSDALRLNKWFGNRLLVLVIVAGILFGGSPYVTSGLTLTGAAAFMAGLIVASNWWLGVAAILVAATVVAWMVHSRLQKRTQIQIVGGQPWVHTPEVPRFVLVPACLAVMALIGFMIFAPPASKVDMAKLIDPTVKVENVKTVDMATGAWMRHQTKTGKSGAVKSEKVTGTIVTNSAPSPTKSVDICSSSASNYTKKREKCPGF